MSDQAKPISRPLRRFLRFSVRGVIVLVFVIGGWLGWFVRGARIQRDAVAAIEKAGGVAAYESRLYHGHFPRVTRAERWRDWAANLIGIESFDDVTYVRLGSGSDSELILVGRFSRLWRLDGNRKPVTDAGLSHLKGMANLKELNLGYATVTDAGLASLSGLGNLRSLSLYNTRITGTGLAHLTNLGSLEVLSIDSTQVTDAGLAHLKALRNLRVLSLDSTQVTDAGLAHLEALRKLEHLSLNGTQISDVGLADVKGLTNLGHVGLLQTKVTDAGLQDLQKALPRAFAYNR
jgi:Leucine Rich repeat